MMIIEYYYIGGRLSLSILSMMCLEHRHNVIIIIIIIITLYSKVIYIIIIEYSVVDTIAEVIHRFNRE